jgi:hypothetical protein
VLHGLLGEREIVIGDLILTEVLQGFRRDRDFRILRAGGGWSITRPTSTGTAQAQAEVERAAGVQRDALGYRPSQ